MPQTKVAFHEIFSSTDLERQHSAKTRRHANIDALADSCWQACDSGNMEEVMNQYAELVQVWEEHKAVIDGLLKRIREESLDAPPAKEKKKKASLRKDKTNVATKRQAASSSHDSAEDQIDVT
jgi:hypothetical protein